MAHLKLKATEIKKDKPKVERKATSKSEASTEKTAPVAVESKEETGQVNKVDEDDKAPPWVNEPDNSQQAPAETVSATVKNEIPDPFADPKGDLL